MRTLPVLALALLAGCPDRPVGKVDTTQVGEVSKDIPVSADVDLLFVIDNSASTSDKQTVFAQNFPNFVHALDLFPTGRPNLHIGVVSSTVDIGSSAFGSSCPHPDPRDDGLLQNTPHDANPAPQGRYLSDVATPTGTRMVNYSGTLEQALSSIAQIGATGCGFESPLEGMKRALDGSRSENAGFLRKGAFLAIVFLTDEDDCSAKDPALFGLSGNQGGYGDMRCAMYGYQCDDPISGVADHLPHSYTNCHARTDSYLQPPQFYVDFLTTLKPPGRTVVALLGGDPTTNVMTGPLTIDGGATLDLAVQPTCHASINGHNAIGRPANRIDDVVSAFGDHGLFRTICQSDYSQTLEDIGKLIFKTVSPCLEGSLDTDDADPDNPGTQLDCTVSDVTTDDTGEIETPIPACPMSDATTPAPGHPNPCWWTTPDPAKCTTTTGYELELERGGVPPAVGTSIRVRCATKS